MKIFTAKSFDAFMLRLLLGVGLVLALASPAPATQGVTRIKLRGEIIDTWCQVSGIMGVGAGSAHHQCAIWCAAGGVPIGILGEDGRVYVLLKVEGRDPVAAQTLIDIQTDVVTIEADYIERDGVHYLIVEKVLANGGIQLKNHFDLGILPFGE